MDPQELTFEQAYTGLEQTVSKLSEGTISLEEAVTLFEQGMQLVTHCTTLLDAAELRISKLAPSADDLDDAEDVDL